MEAEDLVVNEGSEREVIEEICEVFPHVGIAIFSKTLVIEPVDLCNLAGFMVATKDGDALGVSDFESNKESDRFNRIISSINVVA